MALVKCPACGNMVSENANSCPNCGEPIASRISGQVESGTENFSVQAGNRIELTAKTQAEISARTARLSSEGKTVVNVNTSAPQPFTLGVTVWKNDVTIIWNASLGTEKYRAFLYSQGKQFYQSGQYGNALEIFSKINGYADSCMLESECTERIEAQNRARYQAAQETAQLQKAVGVDPSTGTGTGIARYIIGGLLSFVGFMFLIGGGCSAGGPSDPDNKGIFVWGLIIFFIGLVCIIWNRVQHNRYEKKVAEYEWSKKSRDTD